MSTTYKITVEYNGTDYSGWQRQNDVPSIQQSIEEAIYAFCQEKINIQASGRTDAGVHAVGQVFSVALETNRTPFSIMQGINYHLYPQPIALRSVEAMHSEFNARFDAKRRYYRYHIINRKTRLALDHKRAWHVIPELDVKTMHEAAQLMVGEHDFTSFRASECQAKSPIKTIDSIHVWQDGENIFIDIKALSFLHHMVRNITGTLKLIGEGKWNKERIPEIIGAKDRRACGPTAAACGLYFIKVDY